MIEVGTRIVDTETGVRGMILKRVQIQYPGMRDPVPGYKVIGDEGFVHAVRCSAAHVIERPLIIIQPPKRVPPHPVLPGCEEFMRP